MAGQARSYTVDAHVMAGGAVSVVAKGRLIEFDGTAEQGDTLPGPADLLTAAFAACTMKNVEQFSHLLSFRYGQAAITVTAERQDSPPRINTVHSTLRVTTDEPAQRVRLLHDNIRRYGTIFNTPAAVCEVTGDLVVTPSGDEHATSRLSEPMVAAAASRGRAHERLLAVANGWVRHRVR